MQHNLRAERVFLTRFATVIPRSWGATVRFVDGSEVPAQHHPDSAHYRVIAHRCGYQDDTLRYAIEHEAAHLVIEEVLFDRPSPVLWALAHGEPAPPTAAYEECLAQMLQRFARANERPIIGEVPWDALRARFEEVLDAR